MIGIKKIASYVPHERIDNVAQAEKFDRDAEFVRVKLGTETLAIKADDEESSDLAVKAVQNLIRTTPGFELEKIQAVIVVTQNGDGEGLPHTAAIVQDKLGLPKTIAAFDIGLGCSGYVYGLYAAQGFMLATGMKNALLITADPYSKIINMDDRVTSMLFGDAATVTWLGENPQWRLGACDFGTDGSGAEYLVTKNGHFYMNGRQVFNFASQKIVPHIQGVLDKEQMQLDQVDSFLLHQGSAAIVDAITKRLGVEEHQVIKDMMGVGNTVSSSIPLLLEHYAFNSNWNNLVMSGFGVGLSWASAILFKA